MNKIIYWAPRVLGIMFLAFLAIFSLDVFTPGADTGEVILGFLIHNIPVFILALVLWLAWKRELIGGILFILAAAFYVVITVVNAFQSVWYMLAQDAIIAGPAFLIGILFFINWRKKRVFTV